MDATTMINNNNTGVYGTGYYNQPQYNPAAIYGYQPYMAQQIKVPQNVNALTDEEIRTLKNARPTSMINLNIEPNDVLRSMCTHKENGRDVVQLVQDGSNDVWCPICGARWSPEIMSKEEVEELVNKLVGQMQNAKWTGDLPTELSRELFTLIPLIQKYPEIHKYAIDNFNKYYSQNQFVNAQDASVYAQYNSLFGPSYGAYVQQGVTPAYYGQQQAMPAQPQQGYYYQQPQVTNQQATVTTNPYINPMQAPIGVNPAAPNQQFVNQAAMMMPGYAQVQQPVATQQTVAQPSFNFTPPTYQPAAVQTATTDGSTITKNADGTTTSEKKIDL